MATEEEIEIGAAAAYGDGWHGPRERQPGEKMKDVWRRYARLTIEAVDKYRAPKEGTHDT